MLNNLFIHLQKSFVTYIVFIIAILVLINISSMSKKTITGDESDHLEFGKQILTEKSIRPNQQRMAITALNVFPIYLFEKFGYNFSENKKLFISRIPTVIASALLACFVFLWSRKLYGIRAGFFSLIVYTFSPNILAHSRLVTNDLYCASFMFISVYYFIKFLKQPSLKNLLLSSFFTGCAQIAKQTALILFPVLFILILLNQFIPIRKSTENEVSFVTQEAKKKIFQAVFFLIIIVMVINLGYGFPESFYSVYIPLPKVYVDALLIGQKINFTGEGHGAIYLLGKLSQLGFWYYYFICVLLKTPLALFGFCIVSIFLLNNYFSKNVLDECTFIIIPLALFIIFSFFCTAQLGIRYLLPAYPFIHVAIGKVVSFRPLKKERFYKATLISLFSWYVLSSLSFYPHFISYFNELIGDRKNIYKYLADSNVDWGQNGIYLSEYINKHKGKEDIFVNPAGPVNGIVVVNINNISGVSASSKGKYTWLNFFKPYDHIGYSWLVYHLSPSFINYEWMERNQVSIKWQQYYNLAIVFIKSKHYKEAEKIVSLIQKNGPPVPELYLTLGNLYDEMELFESSLKYYKQYIKIDPNYWKGHFQIGNVLSRLGRFEEAIKEYSKSKKLNPDHVQTLVNLGNAYSSLNEPNIAINEYQLALSINPQDSVIHANIGYLYSRKDFPNPSKAVYHLQKSLELDPNQNSAESIKRLIRLYVGNK